MRTLPPRAWIVDGLIAAGLLTVGQIELRFYDGTGFIGHAPLAVNTVAVAAIAAPLAFRRAAPLAVLGLVAAACAVPRLFVDTTLPLWGGLGPFLLALYSASRHARHPADRYALLAPAAALVLFTIGIPGFATWSEYTFEIAVFAIAWLIGQGMRRWQRTSELLHQHLVDLASTESSRAAAALADERARIARELHDVVAHSISVMVVQAGSARLHLHPDLHESEAALRSVESTGRAALVEMRRMLGVLRTDHHTVSLTPQPSLHGLDHLAAQMRHAGLSLDVHIDGAPVALPPGLDLSAYRIVQESLTNVLKHGGPTQATVRVTYRPDRLLLQISNDPGTTVTTNGKVNHGHGLVGMRERVALFGGTLRTVARPDGGYQVDALLPLPAVEPR